MIISSSSSSSSSSSLSGISASFPLSPPSKAIKEEVGVFFALDEGDEMEVTNPAVVSNRRFSNFSLVDWTVPFVHLLPLFRRRLC